MIQGGAQRSGLLTVLDEAMRGQVSKATAGYEENADEDLCRDCLYYESNETCERVKGDIDPEATCELFEEN